MANGRHNGRGRGDTMANRYWGDTMARETQWHVTYVKDGVYERSQVFIEDGASTIVDLYILQAYLTELVQNNSYFLLSMLFSKLVNRFFIEKIRLLSLDHPSYH